MTRAERSCLIPAVALISGVATTWAVCWFFSELLEGLRCALSFWD